MQETARSPAEDKGPALIEIGPHIFVRRTHQEVSGAISIHIARPGYCMTKEGVYLRRGVIKGMQEAPISPTEDKGLSLIIDALSRRPHQDIRRSIAVHIPNSGQRKTKESVCLRRSSEGVQEAPIGPAEDKGLTLVHVATHILLKRPDQEIGNTIAVYIPHPSHRKAKRPLWGAGLLRMRSKLPSAPLKTEAPPWPSTPPTSC